MFDLWKQLQEIAHYQYDSAPGPHSVMGWRGSGTGRVEREICGEQLYFTERGTFSPAHGDQCVQTYNEFIWQRLDERRIALSHSRFGRENPVKLFDLVCDPNRALWMSERPHLCGDDLYSGTLAYSDAILHFHWTIGGPRKQESLHYQYRRLP